MLSFLTGRCSDCGTKPMPVVAERLVGRAGEFEVEIVNLPYKACRCGRRARWAFDPGTDFSEQLFDRGMLYAERRLLGGLKCVGCDTPLEDTTPIDVRVEAKIDTFMAIGVRTRFPGYVCPVCGLEQAPPGVFDMRDGVPADEGADALKDALARIGLR